MSKTMLTTRKMTYIAILATLSFLLMFIQFPLIPGASFLQVDFSIVPILLGLLLMDTQSAFAILILRTLLKLTLNNGGVSTLIGVPMNVLAMSCFILAIALIWGKKRTLKRYLCASLVGTLAMTVTMFLLNNFYAVPLYAKLANFDIATTIGLGRYLFAMVIPFNLLQGLIFSVTFYAMQIFLKPVLKKID